MGMYSVLQFQLHNCYIASSVRVVVVFVKKKKKLCRIKSADQIDINQLFGHLNVNIKMLLYNIC